MKRVMASADGYNSDYAGYVANNVDTIKLKLDQFTEYLKNADNNIYDTTYLDNNLKHIYKNCIAPIFDYILEANLEIDDLISGR